MTKMLLALSLLLFTAGSAQAQSCLQQASNNELLKELSTRLSSGGGSTGGDIIITTICTNGYFKLRTVNTQTGSKAELSEYMPSTCQAHLDSLRQVTNVGLSRAVIVSICVNGYLKKHTVQTSGKISELSSDYTPSNCVQNAIDANNAVRP